MKLAFLGEAPGAERTFKGMLRSAGVDIEECWVGYLFEEGAPRDVERLGPVLEDIGFKLENFDPTVIVPMGATPLWAFTGRTDIAKMRGSPCMATQLMAGVKLVPCYDPGYIQAVWKHLPSAIGDIERAVREAEKGPELVYPWREFTLEPTLEEVQDWVYGDLGVSMHPLLIDSRGEWFPPLLHSPLLSVDIETGWGQITCIGFAPDHEHAICIPFVDLREPTRSYWKREGEEAEVWALVKTVLESPVPKLGQNYCYDAQWLLEKMGIRTMNYLHDTRLMHHAIAAELPKDLASLAAAYSEMPQWKSWASRKEEKRDA